MRHIAPLAVLLLAFAGCGGEDSSIVTDAGTGSSGPQEALCSPGDQVTVTVYVDAPGDRINGLHTRVYYGASVAIPGTRDDQSVIDRIKFVVAKPNGSQDLPEEVFINGATVVSDLDLDSDGIDEQVNALLGSPIEPFADGKFVDITFDCVEAGPWPTVADFQCEVAGMTSTEFTEIGSEGTCALVVSAPSDG